MVSRMYHVSLNRLIDGDASVFTDTDLFEVNKHVDSVHTSGTVRIHLSVLIAGCLLRTPRVSDTRVKQAAWPARVLIVG